jgi:hypothetical protein
MFTIKTQKQTFHNRFFGFNEPQNCDGYKFFSFFKNKLKYKIVQPEQFKSDASV